MCLPNDHDVQHSPIYRFSRACLLTSFHEFGNKDYTEATFVIPDVKNLATSRACSLNIILISCGTGCTLCNHLLFTFLCCHKILFIYFFWKDELSKLLMTITVLGTMWKAVLSKVSLWLTTWWQAQKNC